MSDKKYWQSFSELANSEEYEKKIQNEFQEELPFEDKDGKGWLDASTPRRDFLKYLGFSTAAASLASCKTHVRKAVPFANKPENIYPGVAKYYATTYVQDGDVIPVLAKVRDGRPIKIEGNNLCSFTQGGTSARAQASVLDLYDMNRLRHPKERVVKGTEVSYEEVPSFEQLDKAIAGKLAGLRNLVLLTSTVVSPSTKEIIAQYPNLKHVQFDADSYSGLLQANEISFGKRAIPAYNFDKANVIVSLGADFLATWLSPVEFARGYSKGRKINEKNPEMSKHYQFESHMSTTGASADERVTHRPSQIGVVALDILNMLNGTEGSPVNDDAKLEAGIKKVVADLKAHTGNALVVCGSNDVNVQVIVNAINNAIGAYGNTIDWSSTLNYRQGIDAEMNQLVADMAAGNVDALFIQGANPVYEYHDADSFKKALAKVKLTVSFNEKLDETSEWCNYIIPTHHYLESWGDAEPKSGYTSFIQPTIFPLFKTRAYQTSLLKWSGNDTDYETYFRNYWTAKLGAGFDASLQNGVIENTAAAPSAGSYNGAGVANAASAISAAKKGGAIELVLYQKVSVGNGKQGGNPWLLELPDPITRATWDNYVMMSMSMAKDVLGLDLTDKNKEKTINNYEYYPEKPVVELTANGKTLTLPVLVIPGMDAHTIAVAVGFGRSEKLGIAVAGVGQNVFGLKTFNGTTADYFNSNVELKKTDKKYKIAQTQIHGSYEGRTEVVKETTLATFKKHPNHFKEYREELAKDFAPLTGDFRKESTIYPDHPQPGLKWGMSIDMNSCTGCHACVVACHAENNVPVVGKSEVMRYHDMHWLRIDRYFVSDENNPDDVKAVVFQPMLCQHCDNAPCENVCPVAATNHSSEGYNQMTYNRCIGTRYCANNCPYKVRRFNWADYTGADSFPNNQDQKLVGKLDAVVHQMNDDLTRMVLNPDVTVRSRGVIEKCSFCVQRLQEAKLTAKKEDRVLADGDAKTACMTACPTDAIVFGNVHDKESRITKMREDNQQRLFYVIEQLHTLPNVNYLAKIRNTEELLEVEEHHEEQAAEEKKETATEATH